MPVNAYPEIQSFLDYLRFEKRYSDHTRLAYENDLLSFFDFLSIQFGMPVLSDINHSMVRSWLAGLKEQEISSRSINRKISSLRSFFKFQMRQGRLQTTPMAQVIAPKAASRLPVFVKEEETKDLIDALRTATEDWKTLNAKMLLVLFYSTGMRLAELINLRERQVDVARRQVKVLGKGNKERIIPLHPDLLKDLEEYQRLKRREFATTDDYLLVTEKGRKMYPKYAYLLVKKQLEQAGTLDKKSPHVLRHTFATHLMNQGADLNAVKELLGHSSLASTQVYTHNTIEKLKDTYKKAHPKA